MTAPSTVPGIDAVLFDIDDTLIDTRAAFVAAIAAVCGRFLPGLAPDRHPEALAWWRTDPSGHYRAFTRGETDFETQRRARADEIQEAFGGSALTDASYREWAELFVGTLDRSWAAFDDAHVAVNGLLADDVRLGAVSNAQNDVQVGKLAATGFADTVPLLVGLDTFGVGKPDPRVWLEACRRLDVDPARTAYVGDELDIDAGGAQEAGLVGVWLDRPGTRRGGERLEDPDVARERGLVVVRGLDELSEALGTGARR